MWKATAVPTAEATATPEATTTAGDAEELAFTGDMTGFPAIGGSALLGAGLVIASRRRS